MTCSWLRFGILFSALAGLQLPAFAETIGNLPYWANPSVQDGYGGTEAAIGAWNGPLNPTGYFVPAPTVGQVITTPANNTVLQSFTVAMPASPSGFQINFIAAVFAWDQADFRPVGSALVTASITTPILSGTTEYLNDFDNVTFSPDVQLLAGHQYVVLFSTLGVSQPFFYEATSFGVTPTDTYSGGEMIFASEGTLHETTTPLSSIEAERWGSNGSCDELNLSSLCASPSQVLAAYPGFVAPDLAFSADFESSIPEPGALALASLGFLALLMELLRRRKCAPGR